MSGKLPRIAGITGEAVRNLDDRAKTAEQIPPFGLFKVVEFSSDTQQKVYHGLKLTPNGYIVVANDNPLDLYISEPTPDSRYLFLSNNISGATVKAKIWFF